MNTARRSCITGILIITLATPAQAETLDLHGVPASDRHRIEAALDREDVRAELHARGVGAEQAKARVAALTDDEARELAAQMDSLPAGGFIQIIGYALLAVVYVAVGTVYLVVKGINAIANR